MQRCGLCSMLASLLRRAMCLGSRRGSAESYYQELADTAGQADLTQDTEAVETAADENSCIRKTNNVTPSSPVGMSPTDRRLLCALGDSAVGDREAVKRDQATAGDAAGRDEERRRQEAVKEQRGACFARGRFLTMHKRRRKRLTTRSLSQDFALLDDMLHGQAQCILDQASNWRFNAFTLEVVTGGRSLPILCVHLFHWYGLLKHFKLDPVRVWKLFSLIEEGYHSTNPYHNAVHAADVTQAMHCFLLQDQIRENLEPLEIMAALVGAVAHDLDHPGVNQPFLIATSNHLAALYENTSVLENHHWRSAIGCLLESGVAEQVQEYRPELEQQISSLILATDITRQQEFIQRFKNYLDTGSLDMRKAPDRHFILQISLKCADISNPCRPWDVSKKWSQKVCEEFFRQGDYERQLGLPVTTLCDRHTTSMSKIQVGFYKFVVTPLFDEWHRFLDTPLSRLMMKNLRMNQRKWEALILQETAEETRTEISEAEVIDVDTELDIESSSQPQTRAGSQNRLSLRSVDQQSEQERRASLQHHHQQLQLQENEDYDEDGDADGRGSEENLLPELPTLKLSPTIRVQADGRRYSVPISIVTQPPASGSSLSASGKRRESMPAEHIVPRTVADWDSSLSLMTSTSSAESHVGGLSASGPSERPLSAENLLPEPSIASMTSVNADRLSSVLQHAGPSDGKGTRHLIRQQTFPPLQPGAASTRARYMSTAADLSGGREHYMLPEASSRSSTSSESLKVPPILTQMTMPPQPGAASSSQRSSTGSGSRQKENVDPLLLIAGSGRQRSLNRRRGSAPAPSLPPADESLNLTTVQKHGDILRSVHRRGSVPAAIIKLRSFEVDPNLYVDPEWSTPPNRSAPTSCASSDCGAVNVTSNFKRRSSVPCDTPAKVRVDDTTAGDSSRAPPLRPNSASNQQTTSGNSSSNHHHPHKSSSRRSSATTSPEQETSAQTAGGFLSAVVALPSSTGGRRKGIASTVLGDSSNNGNGAGNGANGGPASSQQRRRGSLPADAVALGYTGSFRR